ncbi:MAG: flavin reductase family protein [Erysipelotrichaceae bacterium]|nr:flavin reductase family protein [Erysipelotrichaceae bacterium]
MRIHLDAKAYMYPQPVLIIGTYDESGIADAMNAAWGGVADYHKLIICLSAEHKTVKNILQKKEFTVSMATKKQVVACDYVGVVSANQVANKLEKTGWHIVQSAKVDAPTFEELPLTLECKLESFDEETELMLCEIVHVTADDSILTNGKIDPSKLEPITYDPVNHTYITLGDVCGKAFHDGLQLK